MCKKEKKYSVAITDSPVFKKVSIANAQCALVQIMIITDHIWEENGKISDGATIVTCLSLLAPHRW